MLSLIQQVPDATGTILKALRRSKNEVKKKVAVIFAEIPKTSKIVFLATIETSLHTVITSRWLYIRVSDKTYTLSFSTMRHICSWNATICSWILITDPPLRSQTEGRTVRQTEQAGKDNETSVLKTCRSGEFKTT